MRDQELLDLQEAYMEVCQYNENTDTEDLTEAGMRYFSSSSRPPERITGRFKSIRRNSTTNPDEDGPYRFPLDRPVNLTNQPANTETPQNTTSTRSAKRGKSRINLSKIQFNSYDYYDTVLSYLLDEGYAETPEAAEAIMVNMSEEWREGILDEANRGDEYATRGMSSDDAITAKIRRRNSAGGYNPDEPRRIERSPTGPIGGGTNSRRDQTKRNRGKRTDLVPASDNPSRLERRVGGPKGGTKNPEVVGTNKHLRSQNFKRNPPKRSTSYYDN